MLATPEWDLGLLDGHMTALGSETGLPLQSTLTTPINKLWKKGSLNKVKDIHDRHPRPENTMMYKTKLNDTICHNDALCKPQMLIPMHGM